MFFEQTFRPMHLATLKVKQKASSDKAHFSEAPGLSENTDRCCGNKSPTKITFLILGHPECRIRNAEGID